MDIERIKDKLSELKVYIMELEEDIPEDEEEYIEERVPRRACERTFQLACEDVLDICNLIIAGKALGLPKDNRDSIKKLYDNKIIPEKLSSNLEDMVSFRNLLLHRYGKVDDSRAYHYLKDEIGDLSDFTLIIDNLIR
jgi:uncharacterized protein YutE (UPF0331/DUF86 family)